MSALPQTSFARFRPMLDWDLEAIMDIELQAYEFAWSKGVFRDCLRTGYCCWVYEEGEVIQTYGVMSFGGPEAHILNLCVRPENQGRGLGGKMLRQLLGLARSRRVDTVLLEVRPSNHAALGLYRSFGFVEIGAQAGYYPARKGREDALILGLDLT